MRAVSPKHHFTLKQISSSVYAQNIVFVLDVHFYFVRTFKHPNVLKMLGAVMKKEPWCIVLELLDCDLQHYLRSHSLNDMFVNDLSVYCIVYFHIDQRSRKLEIIMGLANGLEHIHRLKIIHCDIAARNVLVSQKGVAKLADFGLARQITADYFSFKGVKFPIAVRLSM